MIRSVMFYNERPGGNNSPAKHQQFGVSIAHQRKSTTQANNERNHYFSPTQCPRTVADAASFTATGPHAFSQSRPTSSEAPQQRVARLRDAARHAKEERAAGTAFEPPPGPRKGAGGIKAHRVVAVGLIGGTVLAGAVTGYAITDMILFNRRRRAEPGATMISGGWAMANCVTTHRPPPKLLRR